MGLLFSKLASRKRKAKCLIVGLDGAGKTTMLFKMKFGEVLNATPCLGFNAETIEYKKSQF